MSLIWSPGLYSDLLGRSVRARCGLLEPESDLRPSARVLVFASDPDCLLSSPPLRVEAERRARASPPSPSSPSPRPESLTRR